MSIDDLLRSMVRQIVREELAAVRGSRAYSIAEAAERLSISRTELYKLIGRGDIRSLKVGRRRVVPESEIERLLTS
jgi:excisionase family DNA binding protein